MTKRTKSPAPNAAKLVRTMARAQVGAVPPGKLVPDKRRRPPKHKQRPAQDE